MWSVDLKAPKKGTTEVGGLPTDEKMPEHGTRDRAETEKESAANGVGSSFRNSF